MENEDLIANSNISDLDHFNQLSKPNISHPIYWSTTFKGVGFIFCFFTLIFGVFWNCVFFATLRKSINLQQFLYKTFLSLAIADIISLLSSNIPHITELFLALQQWIYGSAGCSIFNFVQNMSSVVVSLSIFNAAFFIFYSKVNPDVSMTAKKGDFITFITWAIGAAYASPWLSAAKTYFHQYQDNIIIEECRVGMSHTGFVIYYIIESLMFCAFPSLVAFMLLMVVRLKLKTVPVSEDNAKYDSESQILKMTLIMVVSYMILNFPYRVLVLFNMASARPTFDMWLYLFFRIFLYLSCGIKPLIYFIFNYLIRKTMISVIKCKTKSEPVEIEMQATALV